MKVFARKDVALKYLRGFLWKMENGKWKMEFNLKIIY